MEAKLVCIHKVLKTKTKQSSNKGTQNTKTWLTHTIIRIKRTK